MHDSVTLPRSLYGEDVTASLLLAASGFSWFAIVAGVVIVVALCLWALFRRGSIADRARDDDQSRPEGA